MIRRCTECGRIMTEGYCVGGGDEYYCSDECLHEHYTPDEWEKMCEEEESECYYTTWEGEANDIFWVARDKDNTLCLYVTEPYRNGDKECWIPLDEDYTYFELPPELFPQVHWMDEPIEVRITSTK